MDTLSVADLILIAGLALINISLWLSAAGAFREERRRKARLADRTQRPQAAERSPVPLIITALAVGITSFWMLWILLPLL